LQVSAFGSTSITACQCNTLSFFNSTACQLCPNDSSLTGSGATTVTACRCNSNFWQNQQTGLCQQCPFTSLASVGSIAQTACKCPVQTYMNGLFTACVACPQPSQQLIPGATSVAQCMCSANFYLSNGLCTSCPGNSSTISTGASRSWNDGTYLKCVLVVL
jgi:hypothetical protein